MARSLITMLSEPGDVVFDPFSGRGTTLLEARLTGRVGVATDLNPIAVALSRAKASTVSKADVLDRLSGLETAYDEVLYLPEAHVQSDDIGLIYAPRTLAELCYLRRALDAEATDVDAFLVGVVLGIMHGAERQDGSSAYASISMPNTFSMAPDYVRRYVAEKRLQRVHRDVFGLLRDKVERLFRDDVPAGEGSFADFGDARDMFANPLIGELQGKVDLVVTSPPYLGVVNYARQNWIRAWFLESDVEAVSDDLADNLTLSGWLDFMGTVVKQIRLALNDTGTAVLVIGDVATSSKTTIPLAREFIRRVLHMDLFPYVGCVADRLNVGDKTTRIWKETKGKATAVDRLVFLSDTTPEIAPDRLPEEFREGREEYPRLDGGSLREYALRFAG